MTEQEHQVGDAPSADAPSADAPSADTPSADTPSADTPSADTRSPAADGPQTEARLLSSAMDVIGRPVVTLAGEAIAQVRDVLFTPDGVVPGFTLAGRGLFAGPMKEWLPWQAVHGFGPDAVLIADESALSTQPVGDTGGDVVGDDVLTRSGRSVGTVVDAVLRLEDDGLDLVGYEIDVDADSTRFLPLPDTLSVTEGRLVVPDEAVEFLSTDLAGFGAAVDTFRARLGGSEL